MRIKNACKIYRDKNYPDYDLKFFIKYIISGICDRIISYPRKFLYLIYKYTGFNVYSSKRKVKKEKENESKK